MDEDCAKYSFAASYVNFMVTKIARCLFLAGVPVLLCISSVFDSNAPQQFNFGGAGVFVAFSSAFFQS